jgi:CBS domain-containing protein
MTRQVLTVRPDTDVHDAVELMTSTAAKSLPVVDAHRRCVGIVSRRDVVHLLARSDDDLARDVTTLFVAVERDWLVEVNEGVVTVDGPRDAREVALAETLAASVAGVLFVEVRPCADGTAL